METLKFEDLNLSKEILKAIAELGFEEATPIQSQTIPLLLNGKDLIGQAQTGTGKTAAFGIPVIEKIDPTIKATQAVVLCPTRELAIQVAEGFSDLLKYKKGIKVLPVYGGQSIERQLMTLRKGVQIIIATPGRLMDHLNRRTINFSDLHTVVLDEADEMLNMGFRDDIEDILKKIPGEHQTILFSATMPKPILDLSKKYLNNPQYVKVVHKELTVPNIQQFYYELKPNMKLEVLSRLLDVTDPSLSLVFCNTKRTVDTLVAHLKARGYSAEALHGDMKQSQRDRVMDKFRSGKIELLVATDVAARGIDVDDIDAVFNYDMPQDEEYYVHRIGRTARAGKTGQAHTFVSGREFRKIKDIERYTKSKILRQNPPSFEDVQELRESGFLEEIKSAIGDGSDLKKYDHYIDNLVNEDFTSYEIAGGLIKMILKAEKNNAKVLPEFTEYEERGKGDKRSKNQERSRKNESNRFGNNKSKWNRHDKAGKNDRKNDYRNRNADKKETKGKRLASGSTERLFFSTGKKYNISARDILGAIIGESGVPASSVGEIDIYDKFTFVDVDKKHVNEVLHSMNNNQIKGKKIMVEIAKDKE